MNHDDALREMSVERYLLGELTGDARDGFEDHLFDCSACAEDLKAGNMMLQGVRQELTQQATPAPAAVLAEHRPSLLSRWFNPAWLVPAFAACLAVVLYQSAILVPHLEQQLATARAPEVMNGLLLTGGTARGDNTNTITAVEGHSFLLHTDIPTSPKYSSYRWTLLAPSGRVFGQGSVASEQAKDTVQIRMTASSAQQGENTLRIEGLSAGDSSSGLAEIVSTQTFNLQVSK